MRSQSEIYDRLTAIFREVFLRDDIVLTPQMTVRNIPGWDFFKQIDIVITVEETYGIKFRSKELDALVKISDLARSVLIKTWV